MIVRGIPRIWRSHAAPRGRCDCPDQFSRPQHDHVPTNSSHTSAGVNLMSKRVLMFVVASVFLIAAAAGLYRLMAGFPIPVAGVVVGQTASFFEFVISAALSVMLFRAAFGRA